MESQQSWLKDYFEEIYSKPDPWHYFTSPYERTKYQRQQDILEEYIADPQTVLEIGCAEGAHTLILAKQFSGARITAIEISSNAIKRAEINLEEYADRVDLINSDVVNCQSKLPDGYYDVIIWSESIYYLGERLPLINMYNLIGKILNKLNSNGLLIMANTVNLPQDIPESVLTKRPIIDCYYFILSILTSSSSRSTYFERKADQIYEYQIWAFKG